MLGHLPSKIVFHQSLSFIKGHLSSKVVYQQRLSYLFWPRSVYYFCYFCLEKMWHSPRVAVSRSGTHISYLHPHNGPLIPDTFHTFSRFIPDTFLRPSRHHPNTLQKPSIWPPYLLKTPNTQTEYKNLCGQVGGLKLQPHTFDLEENNITFMSLYLRDFL